MTTNVLLGAVLAVLGAVAFYGGLRASLHRQGGTTAGLIQMLAGLALMGWAFFWLAESIVSWLANAIRSG